ncbi:MAG: hypothetical protein P4L51_05200 [Puia sp.]|nr:hypothetical protein [Puia sp.]
MNSTQLDPVREQNLLDNLGAILKPYKFEFFRGDSFQAYIKDPAKALETALLCRTAAIANARRAEDGNDTAPESDIRISIGIGSVSMPVGTLGAAKGAAFLLSGRAFDEMQKAGTRLSIVTENEMANIGLAVMADYINALYEGMTDKQAEVIIALLKGETQQQVAAVLGKSKSTVSQLTHSGRWAEIEKLLGQYEKLLNQLLAELHPLREFNQ